MSDDFDPRLNDVMYLANMPGKDIYGVPVGHMVNAIESAADRITELEARNMTLQAPATIEVPAKCSKCGHHGQIRFDTTGASAEALRRFDLAVKTLFFDIIKIASLKRILASIAVAFVSGLVIGWALG